MSVIKALGVVRQIDDLGRIVIPAEVRKTLNWEVRDPLEIYTSGDSVILKKYQPGCIFCGSLEELEDFRERKICKACCKQMMLNFK